jgi:hypothetical protein
LEAVRPARSDARSLAEAERYTREADRRRGGKRAVVKLNEHRKNKTPKPHLHVRGKSLKPEGNQSGEKRHGAPKGRRRAVAETSLKQAQISLSASGLLPLVPAL